MAKTVALVVAGTHAQFMDYQREHVGEEMVYVIDPNGLHGYRREDAHVTIIGTGYEKLELIDRARQMGFKVEEAAS